MIKIVYNDEHGGFKLNEYGLELFERNKKHTGQNFWDLDARMDVLVHLVERYGQDIAGQNSHLAIAQFPIEYKDCLQLYEYDGQETIVIDYNKYTLDRIKSIVHENDDMNANEKLMRIIDIINESLQHTYSNGF
jgi:hypothetical protein